MKIKNCLLMFIPINRLKIYLYNKLLHYKIDKSCKIGFSYIDAVYLELGRGSIIGNFNLIKNCNKIVIKENSTILKYNFFKSCKSIIIGNNTVIVRDNKFLHNDNVGVGFGGNIIIGNFSTIVNKHYFDLTDDIYIGDKCTIAGNGTEFWTHGFDLGNNRVQGQIKLLDNIYIGAGVKFNFGLKVNSNNIVGMGSILTKSINCEGYLIGGIPAKPISKLNNEKIGYKEIGTINNKKVYRKIID